MKASNLQAGEQLVLVAMYYGLIDSVISDKVKCICPLHGDKNPSMALDFNRGFYYCFGCDASGDAEKLVKSIEKQNGVNDLKALMLFNNIVKGLANSKKLTAPRKQDMKSKRELYDAAYDFYHGLASVDWLNSEDEEVRECRDYMESRGFSPLLLQKVNAKVTYQYGYPLVFPVIDNGKFKGWVSRTNKPEIASYRKYLYNKGFRRATTVVGEYGKLRKFSNQSYEKYVIIVEGYMDRLKLVQFGVENVVALFGWKMSDGQLEKLKSAGIEVVVSALDNDECGKKGTEHLRKHFDVVRLKYLKGIKDPGEMELEEFKYMWAKTEQELREHLEKGK